MGFFDKPEQPGNLDTHRLDELEARVRQLEATVALLVQGAGVTPAGAPVLAPIAPGQPGIPVDVVAQIRQLKADDKLIQAIKLYRQATNLGLKEAKDAVEAM
jgi:large subunit ribosomal protein L7/L12